MGKENLKLKQIQEQWGRRQRAATESHWGLGRRQSERLQERRQLGRLRERRQLEAFRNFANRYAVMNVGG